MKKIFSFLPLIWILFLSGCGSSMTVVEYNDSLVSIVKQCTDSTQSLYEVFQAEWSTVDSVLASLQSSISTCQNASTQTTKLWNFEDDDSLKNWVMDLLSAEINYLQKFETTQRYRNIDEITDEDKLAYDSIVGELYQMESELNAQFIALQEVQEAFAVKHWLKLS